MLRGVHAHEDFNRSDDRAKLALMSTTRPRGWCLVLSFFTACGPSIGDGDGDDGDGTAEASGSTHGGVSQTSDADATRDDTSSSQGETEDAPPCAAPATAPALESEEIAVEGILEFAVADLVPTGLTGADWVKVVPSPVAADEPAYAFVGGYRLEGGYNLVWAPVDAMDAWHEALVPFIHIGDMTLDVDGEGTPRWTAIEGIERAHIAFSSFPFEPEAWQIVDTGELSYFDALELVSYDGGYDVAAIVDGAIVLADLDCGTSEFVDGVFLGTQLRAVDIDGDRQRDLIARGELGVVTYRTGG